MCAHVYDCRQIEVAVILPTEGRTIAQSCTRTVLAQSELVIQRLLQFACKLHKTCCELSMNNSLLISFCQRFWDRCGYSLGSPKATYQTIRLAVHLLDLNPGTPDSQPSITTTRPPRHAAKTCPNHGLIEINQSLSLVALGSRLSWSQQTGLAQPSNLRGTSKQPSNLHGASRSGKQEGESPLAFNQSSQHQLPSLPSIGDCRMNSTANYVRLPDEQPLPFGIVKYNSNMDQALVLAIMYNAMFVTIEVSMFTNKQQIAMYIMM